MNSEEARAVLAAEQKEQLETFTKELSALCDRYKCSLSAVPSVSPSGAIVAEIRVLPR